LPTKRSQLLLGNDLKGATVPIIYAIRRRRADRK
jgi:hypothetical protein